MRELQAGDGGSLYLSTSRRTRPDVVAALEAGLPPGATLHRWTAGSSDDNPYLGLLAFADRFVVTGDSVSMMVEVASLGRPLAIFPLPVGRSLADRVRAGLAHIGTGGCSARWPICCIAWASPAMRATSARSRTG